MLSGLIVLIFSQVVIGAIIHYIWVGQTGMALALISGFIAGGLVATLGIWMSEK